MARRCSDNAGGDEGGARAGAEDLQAALNEEERLFQKCLRSRLNREARRKKELQEKKEADARKCKAALEDAFDNEADKLLQFLEEGFSVETADAYGSTLLSEAAAGGAVDCVDVLLGSGADPNNLGRNKRTPVWRAANAGHQAAVQRLLRGGGDPRTPDDSGVLPYSVANGSGVKMLLECWDVSSTESMRQSFIANQKKLEQERETKEMQQTEEMKEALEAACRKLKVAEAEVLQLRRLVAEYRTQTAAHAQKGEVDKMREVKELLQRSEGKLEHAIKIHLDLDWQTKRARLKVRDFENKLRRRRRKDGEVTVRPDQIILLRDLADVVPKDVGGQRREDGRWPLVFDPTGKAATFFTYSGGACFDVEDLAVLMCSEDAGERQRLRLALLKHLMYGGLVVVNLGPDLTKIGIVEEAFNAVEGGLYKTLIDRSVLYSYLLPRRFLSLVPEDMSNDYNQYMFEDEMLSKFVLCFVVAGETPNFDVLESTCHSFYIVQVREPQDSPLE